MCISTVRISSIPITRRYGIMSTALPCSTVLPILPWQIIMESFIRFLSICIPLTRCGAWLLRRRLRPRSRSRSGSILRRSRQSADLRQMQRLSRAILRNRLYLSSDKTFTKNSSKAIRRSSGDATVRSFRRS